MNEGINRATRLVQQLLTLARLDPDASKKPMSTIHLDALIASIRDDMAPIAEQKDIIITASASPAQIDGMEDAIRLMITNLTDNAIRYTPQGGRIELSSSIVNGRSVVRVSDNGPGIAPDERARVFECFRYQNVRNRSGTCHCQTHRRHSSWHSHD